ETPTKTILLARFEEGRQFEKMVDVIVNVSRANFGRFLAFGDSRKMVEKLVAATKRRISDDVDEADTSDDSEEEYSPVVPALSRILPYRAGYEEADRKAIQEALEKGKLSGVVSTSALELGLDI